MPLLLPPDPPDPLFEPLPLPLDELPPLEVPEPEPELVPESGVLEDVVDCEVVGEDGLPPQFKVPSARNVSSRMQT